MSDNIALMQGSGALLSTNDVEGVHVLRAKVQVGADGTAHDVSSDNPMPVSVVGSLQGIALDGPLPEGSNAIGSVVVTGMPTVNVGNMPDIVIGAPLPAGANAIGKVDVTSLPSLPAGGNPIGTVAITSMPNVTVGAALPAGNAKIGSVDVATLPPLPAGENVIGSVTVSSLPAVSLGAGAYTVGAVNVKPTTSGGSSIYRRLGLSASGQSIKSTAGQVYGWHLANTGTSGAFVKLYNVSTTPRTGTDAAVMTLYLPPGQAHVAEHVNGIAFSNGIGIAVTTGFLDTDTTSPTANTIFANVFYK